MARMATQLCEKEVVAFYKADPSITRCARHFKTRTTRINKILKNKFVLKPRGHWMVGNKPPSKIRWKEDFFERRDELAAYWAGFVYGDGSISVKNSSHRLSMFLAEQDKEHLRKFSIALGFRPLYCIEKSGQQNQFGVRVSAIDIASSLKYWGIIPNKTYDFVEPKVSPELLPAFIRGVIDADGYIDASSFTRIRIRITSSRNFCLWLPKALKKIGYTGTYYFEEGNGTWAKVCISGRHQVFELYKLLDGRPRMDRKWRKLDEIFSS